MIDGGLHCVCVSGRTEVQSVQYGKEKGIKDRVFARSLFSPRLNVPRWSLWFYRVHVDLTGRLSCRSPSKPLARKLLGGTDWESVSRNSLSDERLETQSLPTRSPPGTPNQ